MSTDDLERHIFPQGLKLPSFSVFQYMLVTDMN